MVHKKILVLSMLIISCLIIYDIYKIRTLSLDSKSKLLYLDAIYTSEDFENLNANIGVYASRKKSLNKYFERVLKLNELYNFFNENLGSNNVDWSKFVDKDDITAFTKEVGNIPDHSKHLELNVIRDKFIYSNYLNYIICKLGNYTSGCFFSKYNIIKDLDNNLTFTSGDFSLHNEIISVNGIKPLKYNYVDITLPIADTLNIVMRSSRNYRNFFINNYDNEEYKYVIDINELKKGKPF